MIRLAALLLLAVCAVGSAQGYDYSYTDPYMATVSAPDSVKYVLPTKNQLKTRCCGLERTQDPDALW
jgi:hypothetical protein